MIRTPANKESSLKQVTQINTTIIIEHTEECLKLMRSHSLRRLKSLEIEQSRKRKKKLQKKNKGNERGQSKQKFKTHYHFRQVQQVRCSYEWYQEGLGPQKYPDWLVPD
jgi:hypothetical protein